MTYDHTDAAVPILDGKLSGGNEFDIHVALGVAARHARGESHPYPPHHYAEAIERARLALVNAGVICDTRTDR